MNDKPTFTFRDGMTADEGYIQWITDIKQRFRQSQIKAAVRVNTAMLEFYWSVGRDLVMLRAEERWGAGVVKQFALDMRQAFPDETGFSDTNVKYMKRWYLFYYEKVIKGQRVVDLIGHQVGDELEVAISKRVIEEKGQHSLNILSWRGKGNKITRNFLGEFGFRSPIGSIVKTKNKRVITISWDNLIKVFIVGN